MQNVEVKRFLLEYSDSSNQFEIYEAVEHVDDEKDALHSCFFYPEAVEWLKNLVDHGGPAEFEVIDLWHEVRIYVKDGKAVGYDVQWDEHTPDARMLEAWGLDASEGEEVDEADCLACGDGGCINCRPEWFM